MKRQLGFLFLAISLCNQGTAELSKHLTPLSNEILKHFLLLWKESGYGYEPNHIETAEWIILNSENNYEFLKWPLPGKTNKASWNGQIPKN